MKIPRKKGMETLIILKPYILINFQLIIRRRMRKKLRKRKRRKKNKKNKQVILENNTDYFDLFYSECSVSLI